ncbi:MAG: 50S ribosomal protein L6 [Thermoplasmata archaeon]|nr:50S ribosomal protein L6 [Thermoplasmata archaeon]
MPVSGQGKDIVEIPKGVNVQVEAMKVTVTGPKGTQTRTFPTSRIKIARDGDNILLTCILPKRKEYALQGTIRAHINNMIEGVTTGFEYKMKIVYSHFPIKVAIKGTEFVIDNFLGEKFPRRASILGDTKVTVKGDEVILTGTNVELVGQTAANIEQATIIKEYDPRKFQDGIYIVKKGGKADA